MMPEREECGFVHGSLRGAAVITIMVGRTRGEVDLHLGGPVGSRGSETGGPAPSVPALHSCQLRPDNRYGIGVSTASIWARWSLPLKSM
jgi:hypothetical protein